MTIESTDNDKGNSFEYRLKEVSDEEIVSILRYRNHFQPQAVKDAIKEALKRGIISSIDDLELDEFKPQSIPAKSLFPISSIEGQNIAIFKSLSRICYGFGIIPFIFGILEIANKRVTIGFFSLIIGISIVYITFNLEKERKRILSQLLLSLNVPAIIYAIYRITSTQNLSRIDIAAIFLIILILLYITFYIHKLTVHFNRNSNGHI